MHRKTLPLLSLLVLGSLSQLAFSGSQQERSVGETAGFWLLLLAMVIVLIVLAWWALRNAERQPAAEHDEHEHHAPAPVAEAEVDAAADADAKAKAAAEAKAKAAAEAEAAAKAKAEAEAKAKAAAEADATAKAEAEAKAAAEAKAKAAAEAEPAKAEAAAPAASGEPDDLQRIEGIGPKVSAALIAMGITTFAQIAKADPEKMEADIKAAGVRIISGAPATWPEQAALAAKGDWEGFDKLTDSLKGGRRA